MKCYSPVQLGLNSRTSKESQSVYQPRFFAGFVTMCILKTRRVEREGRDKVARERQQILSTDSGSRPAKLYSKKEMKRATKGFAKERLLGSGGFGEVYKGILDDGTEVAVKAARIGNVRGTEQVLNEVRILSQVNHQNLVRLLGCCVETEQPLLVYEYVSNGTLHQHLTGSRQTFLSWRTRLNIALETAEGLAHLHFGAYRPIYHRDVKSSNILLNDALHARLSDFGMSRLAQPDVPHISSSVQGTPGYLDPQYYRRYQLTDKSDVYSFGVVLLELITSERPIDFSRGEEDASLAMYALRKSENGQAMDMADERLREGATEVEMETMKEAMGVALECIRESREERPSMRDVRQALDNILRKLNAHTHTNERDKSHLRPCTLV